MKPIEVTWLSSSYLGGEYATNQEINTYNYQYTATGYLVKELKDHIILAQSLRYDNNIVASYCNLNIVPRQSIIEKRILF